MSAIKVARLAFNRGLISRLGLARADIQRVAFSAEVHTNMISRVLGSMSLRPGFGYLGNSLNNNEAHYFPFVFSITDKALIELTDGTMRVWINDTIIVRSAVTATVTNPSFTSNLTGWTDADEGGGTSQWTDGSTGGNFSFTGGYMGLTGNGTAAAIRYQRITVTNTNAEHVLNIVIANGPVVLRVGSSAGNDDYISEASLGKGSHSLALTPTGDFYIQFQSRLKRQVLVDSCTLAGSGNMTITTPWASDDLDSVRAGISSTSADIIYVACEGIQQQKIERRSTRSWSVVTYEPEDGPFKVANVSPTTLVSSALSGNVTLTASLAFFKSTHVGALFRITSDGQEVSGSASGQNQFTNAIRITGVGSDRAITVDIQGTWVATVTLQRSVSSDSGPWVDVTTWTANTTTSSNDELDNQIAWYRIGVKTGGYTSGTVTLDLKYPSGSISGTARVTKYTSATSVYAEVITDFGSTVATDNWEEERWSSLRGFPTAVGFFDGRLVWAGKNLIDLSISDSFESFDSHITGDSSPISRSIGFGPVDTIEWMVPLQRLLLGGQGAEFTVMSSSLDEPITPTNFNLRSSTNQGSAKVAAVAIDQSCVFAQRGGSRVYKLMLGQYLLSYEAKDLSALTPNIGSPGIVKMAVQRQPDTRVHCVRSDGTVALLIFDEVEQVNCWIEIETDGEIEDVVILPGDVGDAEDFVYYSVNRTINGSVRRSLEKWAFESECLGDAATCKLADSFITYSQTASSTISVPHLVGEDVVVWDNGICLRDENDGIATFTVGNDGTISVTNAGVAYQASVGVVGLPYMGQWMSGKFSEILQTQEGNFSNQQIIRSLTLVMANVHARGIKYGYSLTENEMNNLPGIGQNSEVVDIDDVHTDFVTDDITFPGVLGPDARLCLLAQAPRPVTVLAAVMDIEANG